MTGTTSWTTDRGNKITASVTIRHEVKDNNINLDGHVSNVGRVTVDTLWITVTVNGSQKCSTSAMPTLVTREWYSRDYDKLVAKGIYARVGDMYLTQDQYNQIMGLVNAINAEMVETAEYAEVKKAETEKAAQQAIIDEKEEKDYQRQLANGLCPKCGTYCYGDC